MYLVCQMFPLVYLHNLHPHIEQGFFFLFNYSKHFNMKWIQVFYIAMSDLSSMFGDAIQVSNRTFVLSGQMSTQTYVLTRTNFPWTSVPAQMSPKHTLVPPNKACVTVILIYYSKATQLKAL